MKRILLALICLAVLVQVAAQPSTRYVNVNVAADKSGWTYQTGEKAKFNVSIVKNNNALEGATFRYVLSEDTMEPFFEGEGRIKNGMATIDGGTLKVPGFIRCRVSTDYEGKTYQGVATAAFDPGKIEPTVTEPADFMAFWEKAIADNAKIPLDTRMTLVPEKCTGEVDVYHVSVQNYRRGVRVYGMLCMPKAPGKYPAVLRVPGAGIRPYNGNVELAAQGYITLEIGIHGIPVDLPAEVYANLSSGALANYGRINLDDKDNYYFKRVYLGCVRAVDFIFTLAPFNGNVYVLGGSQGGALSIVTAALDKRILGLMAYYPALADVTGYINGRAGGWPHFARFDKNENTPQKVETMRYYDVVNFARHLTVPGFYSFGYNDVVCPPTSMYAAYNQITAPKELMLVEDTGHFTYPEQQQRQRDWLDAQAKNK